MTISEGEVNNSETDAGNTVGGGHYEEGGGAQAWLGKRGEALWIGGADGVGGELVSLPQAEPDHIPLLGAVHHVALRVQAADNGGCFWPMSWQDTRLSPPGTTEG